MKKNITVFVCMLACFSVHSMDMIFENNVIKNVGSSEILDYIEYCQGKFVAKKFICKTTREVTYKATEYIITSRENVGVSLEYQNLCFAEDIFYDLEELYFNQQKKIKVDPQEINSVMVVKKLEGSRESFDWIRYTTKTISVRQIKHKNNLEVTYYGTKRVKSIEKIGKALRNGLYSNDDFWDCFPISNVQEVFDILAYLHEKQIKKDQTKGIYSLQSDKQWVDKFQALRYKKYEDKHTRIELYKRDGSVFAKETDKEQQISRYFECTKERYNCSSQPVRTMLYGKNAKYVFDEMDKEYKRSFVNENEKVAKTKIFGWTSYYQDGITAERIKDPTSGEVVYSAKKLENYYFDKLSDMNTKKNSNADVEKIFFGLKELYRQQKQKKTQRLNFDDLCID